MDEKSPEEYEKELRECSEQGIEISQDCREFLKNRFNQPESIWGTALKDKNPPTYYGEMLQDYNKYVSTMTTEEYKDYIAAKYHGIEDTVTGNATITKGMSTENHTYTWERIYHFSCGNCKNWWSYATEEDSYSWKSRKMNCPHCGYYTTIQPNPKFMEK